MKLLRAALAASLLVVPLAGCEEEDDDPTGPQISAFAGTWNSTSINYTSNQNPQKTFNASGVGIVLNLVISATGTFTGTFKTLNPATGQLVDIPLKGQVTLVGENQATVDFDWSGTPFASAPPIEDFTATYTLQGNNLTFTRTDAMFAFPPSTTAESATLVIVMVRS